MTQASNGYSAPAQPSPGSSSKDALKSDTKPERPDEHSAPSDSDDGNDSLCLDVPKADIETEEDANAALTSQTLNADGRPKRPMNAFMIFARRRRPQLSAENQSLRTGEISKVLSKEWSSMPATEKQFYLDQAKQLKKTFNTRYPDYVYRRRPNNSRKRKRPDGGVRQAEQAQPVEGQEETPLAEQGGASPAGGDGSQFDVERDRRHMRSPHNVPPSYADYGSSTQNRLSGHPYIVSDPHFRSNHAPDGRVYPPTPIDHINTSPQPSSVSSPRVPHPTYPYSQAHGQPRPPVYSVEQPPMLQDSWQTRMERQPSGWSAPSYDRQLASVSHHKQGPYHSPPAPQNSWPRSGVVPNASDHNPTPATNYPFPTLNTPFYPNVNHLSNYALQSSASPGPRPEGPAQFNDAGHAQNNRDYGRGYSPASPADSVYPSQVRDSYAYAPPPNRDLPPNQSLSNYSPSHPLPSSAPGVPCPPFWSRDKIQDC